MYNQTMHQPQDMSDYFSKQGCFPAESVYEEAIPTLHHGLLLPAGDHHMSREKAAH